MPVPIPDLLLDTNGVSGTLSFEGTPFKCFVPWDAVFALVADDGKGKVWVDEVPPEVYQQAPATTTAPEPGKAATKSQPTPTSFKNKTVRKKRTFPNHLRLVK